MTLYTIPFAQPFLETLVEGIQEKYGHEPLALAQTVVLLPTRRGSLNLKAAFRKVSQNNTKVLPRIIALADLEQAPNLPGFIPEPLPPEMPKMQQLGLLSQLILAFEKKKTASQKATMGAAKALKLAEDLLGLLDEIHTSDVDPAKLNDLVGAEFAHHWQITLDFLQIITDFWPTILAEKGFMDSSIRRRENLRLIAKEWHPDTPVILAGTTATRPATAELALAISHLKNGHVVLPGYEHPMEGVTKELPPTHPQYTLSQFVSKLGVNPEDIQFWGATQESQVCDPTQSLLRHMMAPVLDELDGIKGGTSSRDTESPLRGSQHDIREGKNTESQNDTPPPIPFQLLECQDRENEAAAIAVLIRETIHQAAMAGQSHPAIAVITPDQELTRRIQANLQRWNITANSSSGTPLGQAVVGTFLTLLAGLHRKTTSVDWLSLLKHPLFFRHKDRGGHLSNCRQLDLHLRKLRLPNLFTLKTAPEHLQEWYGEILTLIAPLTSLSGQNQLDKYLMTLRKVAEDLCSPKKLWIGPDGIAAQAYLQEMMPFSADYPKVSALAFSSLLSQLLNQQSVHAPEGIGSPIMILGALEARQYSADITILAGLNEGTWPKGVESDPWLNHQMRLSLGLPDPQRRIGLSAHDFCIGFSGTNPSHGGPSLYLTRPLKSNGTSTTPSRWWQRLEVTLEAMGVEIPVNTHIPILAKQLDHPMAEPMAIVAPSPRPPKDRRPLRYSVTDVEQLMRDPYSHYAKRILGLKKLDSLDRDLEARDFGQLAHQALDDFQKTHGASQNLKLLLAEGHRVFAPLMNDAIVKRFWWPRFEQIAHWLHHAWLNRPDSQVHTELPGSLFLMISDDQIELKTIIDRVEVSDHSGTEYPQVTIIDYKTGALPTQRDVANGLSPQLALESLIFLNGGCSIDHLNQSIRFKGSQLTSLQYWYLKGGLEGGEIRPTKNLEELLVSSKQGLLDLLGHFIRDQSPYLCCPWDESTAKGKDFHHLARLKEWNG